MTMTHCPPYFFVLDVESIGLHGDGFAAGWCVVDRGGHEHTSGIAWTMPDHGAGRYDDFRWVQQHVVPALLQDDVPCAVRWTRLRCLRDVRRAVWSTWREWQARGAWMAADVPWPVEARFMAACVDHDEADRGLMPYPMVDVASVRLAAGLDPLDTSPRLEGETPAHNPLADARQSARLLVDALARGAFACAR